ncbi:beta-glucosidase/6-phospho-beta-glucosidase/beta-galactosidase [Arthrobacter sp. PL16]|uniref:family 1 glycosylhydrolase n=1 Tax=Arthrobacter sp. PL16 TaxID=3071720 RepID=UPI002E06D692|nr:beta-glucosidase/6-phospho-beta-glucosidase/beta-galactosidase [Arthrobacter sp. PL16]
MGEEIGLATEDEVQRVDYLRAAVDSVASCLADGMDVCGYITWPAFDNYEWVFGYGPKFGLIAVDRNTQEQTPKDSARWPGRQPQEHAPQVGVDTPSDVVQRA